MMMTIGEQIVAGERAGGGSVQVLKGCVDNKINQERD